MNDQDPQGSQAQALRALAFVVRHIRPDWDEGGLLTKLHQTAGTGKPFDALALAAIRAACDPGNRSPGIILFEGPHWRDTTMPAPAAASSRLPGKNSSAPLPPFDPVVNRQGLEKARREYLNRPQPHPPVVGEDETEAAA